MSTALPSRPSSPEPASRPGRSHLAVGLALALVTAAAQARPAAAQTSRTVVGGLGGFVHNDAVWSRELGTEAVGGAVLGAWVNVPTPVGWLSVTAEGSYTRRGSDTRLDEAAVPGAFGPSPIRTDYLTASVLPRATLTLGRVRVHLTTGPTTDLLLRSRVDPVLDQLLDDGATAVFAWTAGAGIGADVGPRWVAELEARIVGRVGLAR
ncbi:MAG: hypothetical protein P8188_09780 [Gemmatimonadota bacterium]